MKVLIRGRPLCVRFFFFFLSKKNRLEKKIKKYIFFSTKKNFLNIWKTQPAIANRLQKSNLILKVQEII